MSVAWGTKKMTARWNCAIDEMIVSYLCKGRTIIY